MYLWQDSVYICDICYFLGEKSFRTENGMLEKHRSTNI